MAHPTPMTGQKTFGNSAAGWKIGQKSSQRGKCSGRREREMDRYSRQRGNAGKTVCHAAYATNVLRPEY